MLKALAFQAQCLENAAQDAMERISLKFHVHHQSSSNSNSPKSPIPGSPSKKSSQKSVSPSLLSEKTWEDNEDEERREGEDAESQLSPPSISKLLSLHSKQNSCKLYFSIFILALLALFFSFLLFSPSLLFF